MGCSARSWTILVVLALSPATTRAQDVQDLYQQAQRQAEWLDWEESIALLDRAIELQPEFADAWHLRGSARVHLSQYQQAIEDLSRAIELNPKNSESHARRGEAHAGLGNLEKAIADFTVAIDLQGDNSAYYFSRGDAQLMLGENAKAISDLTEAIRLSPEFVRAYRARGLAFAADGQNDNAIADFRKVIELEPGEAQDWHNLGVICLRAGQHEQAIESLTAAVQANPQRDNSFYSRASAYLELGRLDDAQRDLSRVLEINPQKADAWGRRGLILLEQGDDDDARRDLERCFELSPDSRAEYLSAADGIRERRKALPATRPDVDEAAATLEQAVHDYEAAAKAGDVERIGQLYYEPIATPFLELFATLTEIGRAKKRLAEALDVRFGRQTLNLTLVDDQQVRQQMSRLLSIEILSRVADEQGFVLGVEITEAKVGGRGTNVRNETFLARRQEGQWKVGPYRGEQDLEIIRRTCAMMRQLPPLINRVANDVSAGQYISRHDAEQAALLAIAPVMKQMQP